MRSLLRAIPMALLFLSASCAPQWVEPTRVRSPDGSAWWYQIECSGNRITCTTVAAHACKHGYDIVGLNQHGPPGRAYYREGFGTPNITADDEIYVECRPEPDAEKREPEPVSPQ